MPMWKSATEKQERLFWHEYFYQLIESIPASLHQGKPDEC